MTTKTFVFNRLAVSVKEVKSWMSWTRVSKKKGKIANSEKHWNLFPISTCHYLEMKHRSNWKETFPLCLQNPLVIPFSHILEPKGPPRPASRRLSHAHTHTHRLPQPVSCRPYTWPCSWAHSVYSLLPQAFALVSSFWTAVPHVAAWPTPLTPSGLCYPCPVSDGVLWPCCVKHCIKHTCTLTAPFCPHILLLFFFIAFLPYLFLTVSPSRM